MWNESSSASGLPVAGENHTIEELPRPDFSRHIYFSSCLQTAAMNSVTQLHRLLGAVQRAVTPNFISCVKVCVVCVVRSSVTSLMALRLNSHSFHS